MADSDVEIALVSAVKDLLDENSVDTSSGVDGLVQWENTLFDHETKKDWFKVTFSGGTPEPSTLGQGGRDTMIGFLQIDLNAAKNSGLSFFDTWFDKFRQRFYAGKVFTRNAQQVKILSVGMSGGRPFENFFTKSVTITFRSELTRNI